MRARAGRPIAKPWTDAETEALRAVYPKGADALVAALPGRTLSAIRQHAMKIGVRVSPHWSPEDDKKLLFLWETGLRLYAIANRLDRRPQSVYWRARHLGLGIGCPQGYEYFSAAAERTGFYPPTLRRILNAAGVKLHMALSTPNVPRNLWRRHFVDPDEVDAAVTAWMKTEEVGAAARVRGMCAHTLQRWLREAGVIGPRRKRCRTPQRAATEVIDRVIEEQKGRTAERLSIAGKLGAAARWGKAA